MTRAQKAVIREAMKIYRESNSFPVKTFCLEGSKVTYRWFKGAYGWMDGLVAACEILDKQK